MSQSKLALFNIPITIANGEALSGVLNVGERVPLLIYMPGTWTSAALTFQVSPDGTTFYDLYDDSGTEVSVASAAVAASRAIYLAGVVSLLAGAKFFKIRSGTSGSPVNQGGARSLTVACREG